MPTENIAEFKRMLEDTVPIIFFPYRNDLIPGDPWRSYLIECERCHERWGENQRVGTRGVICPHCGECDKEFEF